MNTVYGFWGYEYANSTMENPTEDSLDFRFEISFNLDLGVGYEALIFWILREGKNLLVFNPNAFVELSTRNYLKFKLGIIEWTVNVDFTGYRITPVDYQATWDLDHKKDWCHSVGAVQDVFDFDIKIEQRVYECYLGLIGLFVGTIDPSDDDDPERTATTSATTGDDFRDCAWHRYYPELPMFAYGFKNDWDRVWDYYEWTCNYYKDVDRFEESSEYPSNVDEINGFGEV